MRFRGSIAWFDTVAAGTDAPRWSASQSPSSPTPTQDSLPAVGQTLPSGIGYPPGSNGRFLITSCCSIHLPQVKQDAIAAFVNKYSHLVDTKYRARTYEVNLKSAVLTDKDRSRVRGKLDSLLLKVVILDAANGDVLGQWIPESAYPWEAREVEFSELSQSVTWHPGMRLRVELWDNDSISFPDLIGAAEWNEPPQDSKFPLPATIKLGQPSIGSTLRFTVR